MPQLLNCLPQLLNSTHCSIGGPWSLHEKLRQWFLSCESRAASRGRRCEELAFQVDCFFKSHYRAVRRGTKGRRGKSRPSAPRSRAVRHGRAGAASGRHGDRPTGLRHLNSCQFCHVYSVYSYRAGTAAGRTCFCAECPHPAGGAHSGGTRSSLLSPIIPTLACLHLSGLPDRQAPPLMTAPVTPPPAPPFPHAAAAPSTPAPRHPPPPLPSTPHASSHLPHAPPLPSAGEGGGCTPPPPPRPLAHHPWRPPTGPRPNAASDATTPALVAPHPPHTRPSRPPPRPITLHPLPAAAARIAAAATGAQARREGLPPPLCLLQTAMPREHALCCAAAEERQASCMPFDATSGRDAAAARAMLHTCFIDDGGWMASRGHAMLELYDPLVGCSMQPLACPCIASRRRPLSLHKLAQCMNSRELTHSCRKNLAAARPVPSALGWASAAGASPLHAFAQLFHTPSVPWRPRARWGMKAASPYGTSKFNMLRIFWRNSCEYPAVPLPPWRLHMLAE